MMNNYDWFVTDFAELFRKQFIYGVRENPLHHKYRWSEWRAWPAMSNWTYTEFDDGDIALDVIYLDIPQYLDSPNQHNSRIELCRRKKNDTTFLYISISNKFNYQLELGTYNEIHKLHVKTLWLVCNVCRTNGYCVACRRERHSDTEKCELCDAYNIFCFDCGGVKEYMKPHLLRMPPDTSQFACTCSNQKG